MAVTLCSLHPFACGRLQSTIYRGWEGGTHHSVVSAHLRERRLQVYTTPTVSF